MRQFDEAAGGKKNVERSSLYTKNRNPNIPSIRTPTDRFIQRCTGRLDKAISRSAYTWNVWIAIFCVKRTAFDIFLSPGSFVELPHAIPLRKVRVLRYWHSMYLD